MKKKRKNSKQFNKRFKKQFLTRKSVTVIVFAFMILIGIGIGCQKQKKKAAIYKQTIKELNTEIQELENTNKTLEEEKDNIDSDEFKEKMARERLGMIGPDEYSLQQSEDAQGQETTKTEQSKETDTENKTETEEKTETKEKAETEEETKNPDSPENSGE